MFMLLYQWTQTVLWAASIQIDKVFLNTNHETAEIYLAGTRVTKLPEPFQS